MNTSTLFGHFAAKSGSPERHATDALAYILSQSATARAALHDFAQGLGANLPQELHYEAQVSSADGCIPDVIGFDREGHRALVLEGKFWASLTDNQPLGYLGCLSDEVPGLLLFVAPSIRVSSLWTELRTLCDTDAPGGLTPYTRAEGGVAIYAGTFRDRHVLAVTSWRELLETLAQALAQAGEAGAASDVQQLQGLCETMDAEGFLPLQPAELDPAHGRRLYQLGLLIDKVLDAVDEASELWMSQLGKFSGGPGDFGRDLKMHGVDAWLGVIGQNWGASRAWPSAATPLWIEFYPRNREQLRALRQALRQRAPHEEVKYLIESPDSELTIGVALCLKTGVDEAQVVADLVQQLNEIAALVLPVAQQFSNGGATQVGRGGRSW